MGHAPSALADVDMTPEEFARYKELTSFTDHELVALACKYKELIGSHGLGGNGTFDKEDFCTKLHLPNLKIADIIYEYMDTNHDHEIEFDEFLNGMSVFSPAAPLAKRIAAVFAACDTDGSHEIDRNEFKEILSASVEHNSFVTLDDEQVEELIDDIMTKYGSGNPPDRLTLDDFTRLVKDSPAFLDNFEFDVADLFH